MRVRPKSDAREEFLTATGAELDCMAPRYGIFREPGETDESLRMRVLTGPLDPCFDVEPISTDTQEALHRKQASDLCERWLLAIRKYDEKTPDARLTGYQAGDEITRRWPDVKYGFDRERDEAMHDMQQEISDRDQQISVLESHIDHLNKHGGDLAAEVRKRDEKILEQRLRIEFLEDCVRVANQFIDGLKAERPKTGLADVPEFKFQRGVRVYSQVDED